MVQDNVQLLTNGISKNSGPTISSCMIEIIPTVQLTTTRLQLRAAKKLQSSSSGGLLALLSKRGS